MTSTVLHVFPDSVVEPGQEHLGSTKDIRGRTQYFAERGMSVDEVAHQRSAGGMLQALRGCELSAYQVVMVEFPLSARAMSLIRKSAPDALVLTRSENAELLHRRDWIRAMGPSGRSVKLAARTALTTNAEFWAGRRSDAILSISPWEAEHYWPKMTRGERVHWLPYYVPDGYLSQLQVGEGAKEKVCVCLTSTKRNPLIEDSVRGFERAVAGLADRRGWRFVVTGEVGGRDRADLRIEKPGMLASPGDVLRGSLLVALLSDLGFGFKTKLLEAVVARNRVVVTPGLFARIPTLLHDWTIVADPDDPNDFEAALEAAEQDLPVGNPNDDLRLLHHAVLDHLISEHSAGRQARAPGDLL